MYPLKCITDAVLSTESIVDSFFKALKVEKRARDRIMNVAAFVIALVLIGASIQILHRLLSFVVVGKSFSFDIPWQTSFVIGFAVIIGTWLIAKLARRLR